VTPTDDDATEEDTVTSTDQDDPLAVYYADVLAATNKFYAAMDRQAAEEQRQAEQAQARADDIAASMFRSFEERERKSRAAAARVRAERAKAQAADQTRSPQHDG
jgi:hypothetical protein